MCLVIVKHAMQSTKRFVVQLTLELITQHSPSNFQQIRPLTFPKSQQDAAVKMIFTLIFEITQAKVLNERVKQVGTLKESEFQVKVTVMISATQRFLKRIQTDMG